ncbi:MAG: hypothetical protein MJZ27_06365 [Bacteroidales bacterium]|nr:hypothetical protein [Bacteroidales bacterium]
MDKQYTKYTTKRTFDMKAYSPGLNRQLTQAETHFVFSHLKMVVESSLDWESSISYTADQPAQSNGRIIIPCSTESLSTSFRIGNIPVLFPCSESKDPFYEEENSVIFNHDFIKSVFYLLSGYQELDPNVSRDNLGRFTYKGSIQEKLDIAFVPVVNYYIDWITKGIERWCTLNKVAFKRVTLFKTPVMHLTHNVRRTNYFKTSRIVDGWLQVLGMRPLDMPRKVKFKAMAYATKHALKLDIVDNPWWTFESVMNIEQQLGFFSSWFFLTDDSNPEDRGGISLHNADIKHIMHSMGKRGFDVGILLPQNNQSTESITSAYQYLHNCYNEALPYVRKNLYTLNSPNDISKLETSSILVDCSLHFPDYNGFRNSYCLPFYPFDHENQKVYGILEIPLAINASNFIKNNVPDEKVFEIVERLLDEIRPFNGMCSIQWTNTDFDCYRFPNSFKLYQDTLRYASQYQMSAPTTTDVVRRMISIGDKMF